jgi:3-deoxy-D-manno-octulosonate 8-phosphate phosphatase KdsC-like HAD superfamily phosphatase
VCLISPLAIEHYEAQLVTEMKVFNAQDGQGPSLLKQVCHYTTKRGGGRGAAREVIELILKAQGRWDEAVPLALA